MGEDQQKYNTNSGAVWAGIRDLNDRRDPPYDELTDSDRLDGRTVLLTGATSGLGLAAAREMASRGARLLIVTRRSAESEIASIRSACRDGATVRAYHADMSDFASIRKLVDELAEAGERLDVMVSNAAVVPSSARTTVDGYEEMLQVNALAPACLIRGLLDAGVIPGSVLNRSSDMASIEAEKLPRIVVVASEAHRSAENLRLDSLDDIEPYGMVESTPRYGWTKLLLLTWVRELTRRLEVDGKPRISVNALCPGPVASNIAREVPAIVRPFSKLFFRIFFQSPEQACRPVVYLASSGRVEGQSGLYQFLMRRRDPSALADSEESGRAVWEAFDRILRTAETTSGNAADQSG